MGDNEIVGQLERRRTRLSTKGEVRQPEPKPEKKVVKSAPQKKSLIGEKDHSKRVFKSGDKVPISRVGPSIQLDIEEVSIESKQKLFKMICIDNKFYEKIQEAGKNGLFILEVFHPPNSLDSGAGVSHSQLQLFLKPYGSTGPIEFWVNSYDARKDERFNGTIVKNQLFGSEHPVNEMLQNLANQGCSLAAIYNPLMDDDEGGKIQFIHQRAYQIKNNPPKFDTLCISLHCIVGDSPQILELTPTLYDLGNQGFRLACAHNPYVSRQKQGLKQDSIIHFFFEKEFSAEMEKYATCVERCQMWVTDFAFGVRATGQYLKSIRRHCEYGWNLAAIVDVVDCNVAGLTTVFLIFQAPAKKVTERPEKSEIAKNYQIESLSPSGAGGSITSSRLKRHISRFSVARKSETPRPTAGQSRRQSGMLVNRKAEIIEKKGDLSVETKSRLFHENNSCPEPSYVYAHNHPELEAERILKPSSTKERKCECWIL